MARTVLLAGLHDIPTVAVALFIPLSTAALSTSNALQALSALLQPQGKMLQVTSAVSETSSEAQANMSSGGSDTVETEGGTGKPAEHCEDLSPAALQQIVVQSGVIKAVLQAVRHAGDRCQRGMPAQC